MRPALDPAGAGHPDEVPGYSRAFAGALLDPEAPEPECVSGPTGKSSCQRFNVYRNNVTVSLVDALAGIFPATRRIAGEEFFRALALGHVRASPPASPLLFEYGYGFAGYIDSSGLTRDMAWLGDVARIERAWLDAYHAGDADPLEAAALAALSPQELVETRFLAHPATRIVRSRFPAVTIFAANRSDAPPPAIEMNEPEDALITRPRLEVIVRWLPPGGANFLSRLIEGATLGEAAESAAVTGGFDPAANIEGMLSSGAFAGIAKAATGATPGRRTGDA